MPYQDMEARIAALPDRLQCILRGILEGKRNAEIARDERLAVHTVEIYVSELLAELECRSRVELILAVRDWNPDELAH